MLSQRMFRPLIGSVAALSIPLALAGTAQADTLVSNKTLTSTENAVFTEDGRYFVASNEGIKEIKPYSDPSPNCTRDSAKQYSVCDVVPSTLNGDPCFYSGMTTDGTYLYAACSIYRSENVLDRIGKPEKAALVQVLPGHQHNHEVRTHYFDQPKWYNGMAMLDSDTLLMSSSLSGILTAAISGVEGGAIDQVDILDRGSLSVNVSTWLDESLFYFLPNGIQSDGESVFFVGGQNVFRVPVRSDGSAGYPRLLHQVALNKVLDDFTIDGDQLVIAEDAIINGLGLNSITLVNKRGSLAPPKILTGMTQLSSLMVDPGTFGTAGDFIGTSFFQGGIHRYGRD